MAEKYNGVYIIAADTGNGNVKTVSTCTPTSVSKHNSKPLTTTNVIEYNGSYYVIGQGHKEVVSDKTQDEDYYILTLFCIAIFIEKIIEALAPKITEIVRREIGGYEEKIVTQEKTVSQKSENIRTNDIIEKVKNGNIMPDPDKEEIINSIDSSFMSTFSTKLNIGT